MLVKKWMSKPVITIEEDDSMHEAIKRLKEHNIRGSGGGSPGKQKRNLPVIFLVS